MFLIFVITTANVLVILPWFFMLLVQWRNPTNLIVARQVVDSAEFPPWSLFVKNILYVIDKLWLESMHHHTSQSLVNLRDANMDKEESKFVTLKFVSDVYSDNWQNYSQSTNKFEKHGHWNTMQYHFFLIYTGVHKLTFCPIVSWCLTLTWWSYLFCMYCNFPEFLGIL